MEIKLIIPGSPVVKKSNRKESYRIKLKTGQYKYLDQPVSWYTDVYKDWVRGAVRKLIAYKSQHPEIKFPLEDKFNLKALYYMKDNHILDMNNISQGICDVLAGNEKWLNVNPVYYQIIKDDNCRYIASMDGSRILVDVANPRTEITLSPFIL